MQSSRMFVVLDRPLTRVMRGLRRTRLRDMRCDAKSRSKGDFSRYPTWPPLRGGHAPRRCRASGSNRALVIGDAM